MADRPSTRKLATIMFSDMVGYSALVGKDERLAFRLLERQKKILRKLLPKFSGREVEVIGDAFLVEFDSALLAVQAAIAIQQQLAGLPPEQPDDPPIVLRIALHLGDIEKPGKRVYGDTVNIAARLQELAPHGGIALSATVHHQIEDRIALPFQSIGRPALKNINRPIEIFTVEAGAIQSAPRQDAPTELHRTRPRRLHWAIGGVATTIILGAGIYALKVNRTAPAPDLAVAQEDQSIAVMPLRNVSGDASYEYFSDGLSEDLINALAQIPGLRVISRSSSFQFKSKNDDAAAIGAKLHVSHLLEGSVRREGTRVRVVAQLVKCSDGAAIWTQSYDRDASNVLGVQSEIASSVALQLKVRLLPGEQISAEHPPHDNLAAYDAYLKGNALAIGPGARPKADWQQAIAQYREALRLEPEYAAAQAGLAQTLIWMASNYPDVSTYKAHMSEARVWTLKALTLGPDLADGHAALGDLYMLEDWKLADAEKEYRQALQLAPNNKVALDGLQLLLQVLGQSEAAIALGHQAIAIDPLFVDHYDFLTKIYAGTGRLIEAEAQLRSRRALFPDDDSEHEVAMYIAQMRGQSERVIREAEQIAGPPQTRSVALAMARQYGSDRAVADSALKELIAKYGDGSAYAIAQIYAKRGEPERAFAWLNRAYESRNAAVLGVATDPYLKSLRPDPRFAAMCKKLGLPLPSA